MKNTIIIASIIITVIGLFLWGKAGTARQTELATLATGITTVNITDEIPQYDFGSVSMLKGNVAHEFEIANTTDTDILITQAETSCMCTKAVLRLPDGKEIGPFGMQGHGFNPSINENIPRGQKITIRTIFDPAAHGPAGIGMIEREVLLTTNKGPITVKFKAQVTP